MSNRRNGPRTTINLLRDEIERVAEVIKLRLVSRRQPCSVHVEPDGSVVVERLDEPRRKLPLPDHWLVGIYTPKVKLAELEDDLVCRYNELRRKAA